jgi:ABC-type transport system involved in cytochrome bd biosynthesis fused ATPase/permease subunit
MTDTTARTLTAAGTAVTGLVALLIVSADARTFALVLVTIVTRSAEALLPILAALAVLALIGAAVWLRRNHAAGMARVRAAKARERARSRHNHPAGPAADARRRARRAARTVVDVDERGTVLAVTVDEPRRTR